MSETPAAAPADEQVMSPAQRDYIVNLSARVHGERSDAFLSELRASFPRPSGAQASRWITSLKEQDASGKPKAAIFDYDGTLCDVRGVRHYVNGPKGGGRDFDSFHRASLFCPPNPQVLAQAHSAAEAGYVVIGVTARKERYRKVTSDWNAKYEVPVQHLLMRADDDARPDYEVKGGILSTLRERFNIVHATDDNPDVIRLWREEGIETTLVPGFDDRGTERGEIEVSATFPGTRPEPPARAARQSVEQGRYAVPTDSGSLAFYRVVRPTQGQWAGRAFVSVLASDAEYPVRGKAGLAVLEKIAVDPRAAMETYGREIGQCGRCGRALTDAQSRARGIGPNCATKIG